MDPILVGILGIVLLLVLFILGVPIGFAMGIAGVIGFAYVVSPSAAIHLLATDIFTNLNMYAYAALPMFILMGSMAFAAGLGRRAYDAVYVVMGQLRGGLLVATAVASAIFGAVCGSGAATNVAIGKTAIPEMKRRGYNPSLALGCVACSGTIGFMIPPSSVFILYGILTEQSIGKLFIAGILPGILITGLFVITALGICWAKPSYGPAGERTSLKHKLRSLLGLADAGVLFLLVMGGLFAGWFSPTSAGAIGTAGAIVIGLLRRELTWRKFLDSLRESLRLSCMIFMLIIGAMIFGHFITASGLSGGLVDWVRTSGMSPLGIVTFISAMFFILGCFIDISPILLLLVPLFYPLLVESGYDIIWFGVIVTVLCMIGIVTPPVGTNIYVTKGLAGDEASLGTIIKGIGVFLIPMVIALILLIFFPSISLFLPKFLTY
ncbi:MAG: TRAP transporter large permease subunit [Actinobacteria bacterium]|jgi:tripartite ATP-independent transporter DctM subunit|nr:TRAP transporter large permease subunit [Actinomycetota bacterium]